MSKQISTGILHKKVITNGSISGTVPYLLKTLAGIVYMSDGTTVQSAIDAINNNSTGILANAKSYTDTKVGTIPASVGSTSTPNAKAYIDAKAAAAQAAAESTSSTALDTKIGTIPATYNGQTTSTVKAYIDAYADKAEADAVTTAGTNATTAINNKVGTIPSTYDGKSTTTVKAYIEAYADKAASDASSAIASYGVYATTAAYMTDYNAGNIPSGKLCVILAD